MTLISIPMFFTDNIVEIGSVRRIYFHALIELDIGKRWIYYGTNPADPGKEPNTLDPVFAYQYIAFPQDFDALGQEAEDAYFSLGLQAGLRKEGYK